MSGSRRRARDHSGYSRHSGGNYTHVRGGDHRVTSAWNVTTDTGYWDILVAQAHTGNRFDFHVLERTFLYLGEMANLRLGKLDIGDRSFRNGSDQPLNFIRREPKVFW